MGLSDGTTSRLIRLLQYRPANCLRILDKLLRIASSTGALRRLIGSLLNQWHVSGGCPLVDPDTRVALFRLKALRRMLPNSNVADSADGSSNQPHQRRSITTRRPVTDKGLLRNKDIMKSASIRVQPVTRSARKEQEEPDANGAGGSSSDTTMVVDLEAIVTIKLEMCPGSYDLQLASNRRTPFGCWVPTLGSLRIHSLQLTAHTRLRWHVEKLKLHLIFPDPPLTPLQLASNVNIRLLSCDLKVPTIFERSILPRLVAWVLRMFRDERSPLEIDLRDVQELEVGELLEQVRRFSVWALGAWVGPYLLGGAVSAMSAFQCGIRWGQSAFITARPSPVRRMKTR